MKLVPKKNGKGYFTSFTLSFGSKEAKDLKLLDENGNVKKIKLSRVKMVVCQQLEMLILVQIYIAKMEKHYIRGDSTIKREKFF